MGEGEEKCVRCGNRGNNYLDPTSKLRTMPCGHQLCRGCEDRVFAASRVYSCQVCGKRVPYGSLSDAAPDEARMEEEKSLRRELGAVFTKTRSDFRREHGVKGIWMELSPQEALSVACGVSLRKLHGKVKEEDVLVGAKRVVAADEAYEQYVEHVEELLMWHLEGSESERAQAMKEVREYRAKYAAEVVMWSREREREAALEVARIEAEEKKKEEESKKVRKQFQRERMALLKSLQERDRNALEALGADLMHHEGDEVVEDASEADVLTRKSSKSIPAPTSSSTSTTTTTTTTTAPTAPQYRLPPPPLPFIPAPLPLPSSLGAKRGRKEVGNTVMSEPPSLPEHWKACGIDPSKARVELITETMQQLFLFPLETNSKRE